MRTRAAHPRVHDQQRPTMKRKVDEARMRVPMMTNTKQRPWNMSRPGKMRPRMLQKGTNWQSMPIQKRMQPPMVR